MPLSSSLSEVKQKIVHILKGAESCQSL